MSTSKKDDKTDDNPPPYVMGTGITLLPLRTARQGPASPMRRGTSPLSIFERDDTSGKKTPITIGAVLDYLRQRSGSRKRAMRPRTSRRANWVIFSWALDKHTMKGILVSKYVAFVLLDARYCALYEPILVIYFMRQLFPTETPTSGHSTVFASTKAT